MKTCTKCGKQKCIEDFPWRNKKLGKKHSYCLTCNKTSLKKHYAENKESYLQRNRLKKIDNQRKILHYLTQNPCVQCGEQNPILLDFDHLEPKTKTKSVSQMVSEGWSWIKISKEIKKCQILCVRCHRLKTANQNGWYNILNKYSGVI